MIRKDCVGFETNISHQIREVLTIVEMFQLYENSLYKENWGALSVTVIVIEVIDTNCYNIGKQ